ncbi:MAG: OPT/YSL family transporter [Planctomycetes bacterium]|nr:OPT/YSL family transporter [Planctomycetota bacterium]
MTSVERDRWWLENVYRNDAPQMTVRAVLCGFVLGGLLSAVNLYIGAKTGFSLGTSVTAVVLAYALFSAVRAMGLQSRIGILENNIVQSIACSGGYMSSPLMASMAAYMIVTNTVVPWWQMVLWMLGLSVLGVVFAIPLKRLFINDEQSPFPEGQACGVVLQALHGEAETTSRSSPARALLASAVIAGLVRLLQAKEILALLHAQFLAIPERLDGWYYELAARNQWAVPTMAGTPLPAYTMRLSMDVALVALGGLIGMRTCLSLLLGAIINYAILAPAMVARGDIESVVGPDGLRLVGFRAITRWSLWCGVAIMTTASLWSFAAQFRKSGIFFRNLGRRRASGDSDRISHIEMPMSAFFIGAPVHRPFGRVDGEPVFWRSCVDGCLGDPHGAGLHDYRRQCHRSNVDHAAWSPRKTDATGVRWHRPWQYDHEYRNRRHQCRSGLSILQSHSKHEAGLYARREAPVAGDRPLNRRARGRAGQRAGVLFALVKERSVETRV